MKKLIFFLFTINAFAQVPNIEWQKSFTGAGLDGGSEIIQTSDSGYAFVGTSETAGHGASDVLITKTDSQGIQQWRKFYGGSNDDYGWSIKQTADGGYIICGDSSSNNGNVTINRGNQDAWILKLNSLGEIEWQKTYGGSLTDFAGYIIQTLEGGYIAMGFSQSLDGDHTGTTPATGDWILKLSSNGTIEWQKTLPGYSFVLKKIKQTVDGGYYIGSTQDSPIGTIVNSNTIYYPDFFITKLDSQGDIIFQKNYGGSLQDNIDDIIQTDDFGYLAVGYSWSNDIDVSGHHGVVSMDNGYQDGWVIKVNASGDVEWQKSLGGSQIDDIRSVKKNTDGSYTLLGITGSVDGDVTENNDSYDAWMVNLSSSGTILWQKRFGGTNFDVGYSIISTNDNKSIFLGNTNSNDGDVTQSLGGGDIWMVKLGPNLATTTFEQNNLSVYPNPAKNQINVDTANHIFIDEIIITDVTGKIILVQTENTNQINTENLSTGMYFIQAFSGENKYQSKFIKE